MVDVQSVGGPVADAPAAPQERLPAPVAALPTTRTSAGDDTETIVMLHALIQSKFATLEEFVEEYHLHGSAMPFVAALEKFVEARAWRQPGPATMDVAAQVCGVDDLTEVTVKEVREGIERAKNFPPQSSSQSPCREQVASLPEVWVTRKRKEHMEKEKRSSQALARHRVAAAPWEHGRHEVMFCEAQQNITRDAL